MHNHRPIRSVVLIDSCFHCRLWWPCFVIVFYVLSVVPTLIAKRSMQSSLSGTTPCFEFAIFLTMGFVVCSFALPIVLNRADVVCAAHRFQCRLILHWFVIRSLSLSRLSDQIRCMHPDIMRQRSGLCDYFGVFLVPGSRWERYLRWNGMTFVEIRWTDSGIDYTGLPNYPIHDRYNINASTACVAFAMDENIRENISECAKKWFSDSVNLTCDLNKMKK